MNHNFRCDGCSHNWYSAPGGCLGNPAPHSRCLLFRINVPAVVEKIKGCDGTTQKVWVRSDVPPDCPTFLARSKQ